MLGYPVLSIRSIPKDEAYLTRFFKDDLKKGRIKTPLEISDVWPENYSSNSAQKVWAAKFAAHHPNVVVLDLSSFKCGHDAPTYGIIDSIIGTSQTPYSALHDIDANKPGGSIKIRVKTYAHSLTLHKERLEDVGARSRRCSTQIDKKRLDAAGDEGEATGRALAEGPGASSAQIAELTRTREGLRARHAREPTELELASAAARRRLKKNGIVQLGIETGTDTSNRSIARRHGAWADPIGDDDTWELPRTPIVPAADSR